MMKPHTTKNFDDLDYWLDQFLSAHGPRQSEKTHKAYRLDIHQFLQEVQKPFDRVVRSDIVGYMDTLRLRSQRTVKGIAKTTIARKLASIRSFYRFLNGHEITSINLDGIERPKIAQELDHGALFTREEVKALIKAAKPDPPLHLLVRFLYRTGCRIDETLNLSWNMLEPLGDGTGGEAHLTGKGDKHANVYIPASIWSDLLNSRGNAPADGKVFPSFSSYKRALNAVKRLAKAAGVDKEVTPHGFRHAFISHALAKGIPIHVVRAAARHADISTTGRYAHAESTRPAADALDDDDVK